MESNTRDQLLDSMLLVVTNLTDQHFFIPSVNERDFAAVTITRTHEVTLLSLRVVVVINVILAQQITPFVVSIAACARVPIRGKYLRKWHND